MHPPHATAESATRLDEQYLGASLGRVHGNRYAAYAAANNNYVSGFAKQGFYPFTSLKIGIPALIMHKTPNRKLNSIPNPFIETHCNANHPQIQFYSQNPVLTQS